MTDPGLDNLHWAFALVDGLAAAGVTRAVISPGSRSTPLVLACRRHPAIDIRVHLDERGAAFQALGQAKADGRPSMVIATSGSAPTHWYPAVVEAARSHTPLLLLSADRPPELQSWGANQTLDQQHLFGGHVRAFHQAGLPETSPSALRQIRLFGVRAVEQCRWPDPGPVHLNLPFREPLVPQAEESLWPQQPGPEFPLQPPFAAVDDTQIKRLSRHMEGQTGLILCGPGPYPEGLGPAATELAQVLNCPLLADPLSGLRFGPWDRSRLLTRYDAWLRRATRNGLPGAEWILRLGAAPVSKTLLQYLQGSAAFQVLLSPFSDWPDPLHLSGELVRSDPVRFCRALGAVITRRAPAALLDACRQAEIDAAPDLGPERRSDRPFEGLLIQDLISELPSGGTLFSGNSLPIRQLDTWSGSGGSPLRILCNRGVSGIDGNLATAIGVASTSREPVVALLGDLALLHDLNSLSAAQGLHLIIIVINNGGGGIFGQLPQARLEDFERHWLTPQNLDLERVARLFDLHFQRIRRHGAFIPALRRALTTPAPHLIEVPVDRDYSLQRHRAYWSDS